MEDGVWGVCSTKLGIESKIHPSLFVSTPSTCVLFNNNDDEQLLKTPPSLLQCCIYVAEQSALSTALMTLYGNKL